MLGNLYQDSLRERERLQIPRGNVSVQQEEVLPLQVVMVSSPLPPPGSATPADITRCWRCSLPSRLEAQSGSAFVMLAVDPGTRGGAHLSVIVL